MPDAPEIVSAEPGSFPWRVLHDRHPALIAKVRDGLPYPPEHGRALDDLAREITGVLRPLPSSGLWAERGLGHFGRGWYDVPFLWAESYFYRKLLEAVGYFAPGAWHGVDPFEPFKSAELASPEMATDLAALGALVSLDDLVGASVWGNRADLGFRISTGGPQADPGALVADQSALLWRLLDAEPGAVCLVADNAGRELVPDLVLADHLLRTGRARTIALYVKTYPYYVSDATTADVVAAVRRLRTAAGEAADIGNRLWTAMTTGTLTVRAHPFSVAPWSYDRMPADLAAEFAAATVTIMKGDLNYRRLVGDRTWDPTTPFEAVTDYFPGPVAALRTLKSDVIVGLSTEVVSRLDATGEPWRTNGNHALVQVRQ